MRSAVAWTVAVILAVPAAHLAVRADTSPIRISTEPGGDIDAGTSAQWDGAWENVHGAFFWNGSAWVTNDTAAHLYFTDQRTGQKLKPHVVRVVDPSPASLGQVAGMPSGYAVGKSLYSYAAAKAAGGGSWAYSALRYDVAQPDGTAIVLLSRGTGNGTAQPYLDAFVEEGNGSTTALLGGTTMVRFSGLGAAQAAALPLGSPTGTVRADLPTCAPAERAQYFLDINGGSDQGGVSYRVHTRCLVPIAVEHRGASFAIDFQIECPGADGQIHDIRLLPAIASEGPAGPHLRRRLPGHRAP